MIGVNLSLFFGSQINGMVKMVKKISRGRKKEQTQWANFFADNPHPSPQKIYEFKSESFNFSWLKLTYKR